MKRFHQKQKHSRKPHPRRHDSGRPRQSREPVKYRQKRATGLILEHDEEPITAQRPELAQQGRQRESAQLGEREVAGTGADVLLERTAKVVRERVAGERVLHTPSLQARDQLREGARR